MATEIRRLNEMALDALEEARSMPLGAQRSMALKKAGLLRRTADGQVVISLQNALRGIDPLKP